MCIQDIACKLCHFLVDGLLYAFLCGAYHSCAVPRALEPADIPKVLISCVAIMGV